MYALLRQLLFQLPPEFSHNLSLHGLDLLARCGLNGLLAGQTITNPCEVMGITFPNPVGLAAGLDKNADHLVGLSALGFGFIEVGTVTPRPQPGNPKPRLFRLPKQQAIINRMGFNNLGVDHLIRRVEQADYSGVLGINIGKNKDTPLELAVDDYLHCLRLVYRHASYITVNMSSPNTPGLRDLQFGEPLRQLLAQLKTGQLRLQSEVGRYVPVVVKIAPDMVEEDVVNVAAALIEHDIDGVIATNTTIDHSAVQGLKHGQETGGLSGAPLTGKSTHIISLLARELDGKLPVIGVGGIMNGGAAVEKMQAGASLVQVYSGFIYRGPALLSEINQAILDMKFST